MFYKIYRWFHQLASSPQERGKYSGGYWQQRVRQEALTLCGDISEGRVIEVGCGEGLFLSELQANNPKLGIWGVDNNAERIEKAKARFAGKKANNINLSLCDAKALPFNNEFFDVVVCINVFLNIDSIESIMSILKEIKRICKKSGRIIFDFRNSTNPLLKIKYKFARYYDNTVKDLPLKTYAPKEIEKILNDLCFTVTKKRYIGFPLKWLAPIIIIEAKINAD